MKNDWFNILSEIRNIPIDENLAYELEIFFKDFVFLRNENNTIILRCLKNDKDYIKLLDKEAIENDWNHKAKVIIDYIKKYE